MEQQQFGSESPANICLRQGKKLKMNMKLRKDALEQGSVEFETSFSCVEPNEE